MKNRKSFKIVVTLVLTLFFLLNLSISFIPNFKISAGQETQAQQGLPEEYDGICVECEEANQVQILCWEFEERSCLTMDCTVHAGDCY